MRFSYLISSYLSCLLTLIPAVSQSQKGSVPPITFAIFDFEQDPQGWTFLSPGAFISPSGVHTNGELQITTSDSTNTFGFWESPVVQASTRSSQIRGGVSPDILFRATYGVKSDLFVPEIVPTVRLRLSTVDFAHSSVLSASSTGTGSFSPGPNVRPYIQYLRVTSDIEQFRLNFDVLNFVPSNAANATLALNAVLLEGLNPPSPSAGITIADFDFRGGSQNGFIPRVSNTLDDPFFFDSPEGLEILGSSSATPRPTSTVFGFWHLDSNVTINEGRLYALEWTILTSAAPADADKVPAFRLRVNDSSLMSGAYLSVESAGNQFLPIPTTGNRETYRLYYLGVPEVDQESFLFSFDYLFVPQTNNDSTISVTLESLRVIEFLAQ